MEPVSFGRKLGIGMRLASKAVRQHVAAQSQASGSASRPQAFSPAAPPANAGMKTTAAATRGVVRGTKRFGEAVLGPVAHTSGVLWLEITGLFFALFALYFGQSAYKLRYAFASGTEHLHFIVYSAVTLIFGYFTFSSFYKARRKEKRQRALRATR